MKNGDQSSLSVLDKYIARINGNFDDTSKVIQKNINLPVNKKNEYVVKFLKGNNAAKYNVDLVGKMFNIQDLLSG